MECRLLGTERERHSGENVQVPAAERASGQPPRAGDRELAGVCRVQVAADEAGPGDITIEQNDLFKVLTIASVVGIPPTLIAGLYGMNFRFMPELDWTWGYPFGLALILASALIPLIWFKWRGWF